MPADCTIGVDLGGTNIKGGVCGSDGAVLAFESRETQAKRGLKHVLTRMIALIGDLPAKAGLSKADIHAVGVGSPGPLSHTEGVIHNAPNLPGWVNIPLRQLLAEATGLPVVLENDANAAAFGEFVAGAGENVSSMVMLTLGTGIGGGIVLDGQLWRGSDDAAAEIGHTVIVPGGRPCPCGQAGCLERYASANAVAERLIEAVRAGAGSSLRDRIEAGRLPDARDVLQAADAGDDLANRIWDETCCYLALGCLNIEHVLSPELIVLAGGLANARERLLNPVRVRYANSRWNLTPLSLRVTLATLGQQAGIIGAAALARAYRPRS